MRACARVGARAWCACGCAQICVCVCDFEQTKNRRWNQRTDLEVEREAEEEAANQIKAVEDRGGREDGEADTRVIVLETGEEAAEEANRECSIVCVSKVFM